MNLSPDHKIAGLLAPLFAIRSEHDLGIGDTESLRAFVDWAAGCGFRLVQLLPINETGNDNSPYNAISSVAIDPTTIATSPASIADLTADDYTRIVGQADEARLHAGPVNYPAVKKLKRTLLAQAFDNFCERQLKRNSWRAKKFRAFVKSEAAWLDGYTLFRVLMDENGGDERWDLWPKDHATAVIARQWIAGQKLTKRRAIERQIRFFQYVQWIAFSQWRELKAYCDKRGVALMGDVPFGVSYYSADVFAEPEIFDLTWSGGAPPEKVFKSDPFTEKWGQNWGVPLYRWERMRAGNFAWWRQRVRMVRAIFHLFRIDHVLGFYRIYSFPWRPQENEKFLPLNEHEAAQLTGGRLPRFIEHDDTTHENKMANRQQGEEFLKVLIEEVGEHRLVGEDLGVVPDYVRPNLTSIGVAGFKIPQWEHEYHGALIDGAHYQRLSLTTYATHDHPPVKAMWEALLANIESGDPHRSGHSLFEMKQLAAFAGIEEHLPQPFTASIHEALLGGLFRSNAWIAILMITDLFGSAQRFNVPGAISDSNWSERLHQPVAQWQANDALTAKMMRVRELLRESGRLE